MSKKLANLTLIAAAMTVQVSRAEFHPIVFFNECDYGTPYLWGANDTFLANGPIYAVYGPLSSVYAYLQTGPCGDHGEGCGTVNASLVNGDTYASINHPFNTLNAPVKFAFFHGCDGEGAICASANNCLNGGEISCNSEDVGLAITFCG